MDDLRHRHLFPCCVSRKKLLWLRLLAASPGVMAGRALRLAGNALSWSDWGGWLGWGEAGFQVARHVPVTTSGPGFLLSLGLCNAAQNLLAKQTPLAAISVMSLDLDMQDQKQLYHAHDVLLWYVLPWYVFALVCFALVCFANCHGL